MSSLMRTPRRGRGQETGGGGLSFHPRPTPHAPRPQAGFTLIEIMLGTSILVIVLVAMLGSFFGQSTLNQNSRNIMAAMNDATRVMEEIRRQNIGCTIPSVLPPANYTRWDDWLGAQGKGIQGSGNSDVEFVAVTCQDGSGASTSYCGVAAQGSNPAQVSASEWMWRGGNTQFDPIRISVAVGWTVQQRVNASSGSGPEFDFISTGCRGAGKGCFATSNRSVKDTNGNGVIDSQAMLTTLVTCR